MPTVLPDTSVLTRYFTLERSFAVVKAAIIVAFALAVAAVVRRALSKVLAQRLATEQRLLVQRFVHYLILGLASTWALREIGFDVGVLLGAAGAVTVALGFASQTSASNLISGLFLIVEQPFGIGDTIEVAGITGEVLSIDLLSTKLKTPDNQFVRIPNEIILKSPLVNLTRFDTRQSTLSILVDAASDAVKVRQTVLEVAQAEAMVLEAPKPLVFLAEVDGQALRFNLILWSRRAHIAPTKSQVLIALQQAFAAQGIALPRPLLAPPRHP